MTAGHMPATKATINLERNYIMRTILVKVCSQNSVQLDVSTMKYNLSFFYG